MKTYLGSSVDTADEPSTRSRAQTNDCVCIPKRYDQINDGLADIADGILNAEVRAALETSNLTNVVFGYLRNI